MIAIQHNSKIKGIIVNEVEKKIDKFAYDTGLSIVAENESLSTALICINHFKYTSKLGMNKSKSAHVRIGSLKYSDFILLS